MYVDKDTTRKSEPFIITTEVWTSVERRAFIEEVLSWPVKKIDEFLEAFGKDLPTKGSRLRRKEEALEMLDHVMENLQKAQVIQTFNHFRAR